VRRFEHRCVRGLAGLSRRHPPQVARGAAGPAPRFPPRAEGPRGPSIDGLASMALRNTATMFECVALTSDLDVGVGGSVRDDLRGAPHKDRDWIAVTGRAGKRCSMADCCSSTNAVRSSRIRRFMETAPGLTPKLPMTRLAGGVSDPTPGLRRRATPRRGALRADDRRAEPGMRLPTVRALGLPASGIQCAREGESRARRRNVRNSARRPDNPRAARAGRSGRDQIPIPRDLGPA